MRQQIDRYFELLPVLTIVVLLLCGEKAREKTFAPDFDRADFDLSLPQSQVEVPRLIFR